MIAGILDDRNRVVYMGLMVWLCAADSCWFHSMFVIMHGDAQCFFYVLMIQGGLDCMPHLVCDWLATRGNAEDVPLHKGI